jgi:hypothetical protein
MKNSINYNYKHLAVLLAGMFIGACSMASDDQAKIVEGSMSLYMSIDQKGLSGGKVVLSSLLVNGTGSDMQFLPWNTPLDSSITGRFLLVTALPEDGSVHDLKYHGPMVKRMAPTESDYLTVKEGGKVASSLDITNVYTFCADVSYIVQYSNDIFDKEYNSISIDTSPAKFVARGKFSDCD